MTTSNLTLKGREAYPSQKFYWQKHAIHSSTLGKTNGISNKIILVILII